MSSASTTWNRYGGRMNRREDPRPGPHPPLPDGALQGPHHRRPHRDDAAALDAGAVHRLRGPLRDPVALGVHPVGADSSSPRTGRKVPGPTSRVTKRRSTPRASSSASSPRGEVEPGGRSRDRAVRPRVDGLVAGPVLVASAPGRRMAEAAPVPRARAARPPTPPPRSAPAAPPPPALPARWPGLPRARPRRRGGAPLLAWPRQTQLSASAGPDSARDASTSASGRTRSSSTLPPLPCFRPRSRAGMTRVSLRTSTSPLRSRPGQSRNRRWATAPEARFSTSSREASRSARGAAAMRPSGRSKS